MKKRPVKERIVETASELFYKNGYNRTGINEILEKSGVAKASMYQHFRSKEEIGVEYLIHMEIEANKKLSARIDAQPKGKAKLLAIIDHVADFFESGSFRGCWSLNTIAEISKDDKLMMEEIIRQKKAMKAWFLKLVEENITAKDPSDMANRLYMMYEAALMEARVFNEKWPIETARAMSEEIIEKG